MKKNILATTIALTALVGYITYEAQSNTQIMVLSANVEALADDAGEETKVGTCYIEQSSANSRSWLIFCDSKTDNDHIYPCPNDKRYGGYSIMSTDRCTK